MKYNLVGIDGNAFSVMWYVREAMRKEGYSIEERKAYTDDATSGDYNHFVNVYAHVHNNANYKLVSSCGYCTSVEVNDYTPVEMSAIQKLISDERKKIDLSLFE